MVGGEVEPPSAELGSRIRQRDAKVCFPENLNPLLMMLLNQYSSICTEQSWFSCKAEQKKKKKKKGDMFDRHTLIHR